MIPIARLGDKTEGTCYCHITPIRVSGTIISASEDHMTNNRGTARAGDIVLADCGHEATIATFSTVNFVNNRGVARLGDVTEGCHISRIVTASEDTFSG